MPLVVGVSFKKAGKVYYFDPAGFGLREGEFVITETARGIELGEVLIEPREVGEEEIVPPLKRVIRKATAEDLQREESNKQKERHAFTVCHQKIQAHALPMKLIDAEYCFDASQVTFYFSAESRVDFRELVKDLAGALRTKVQLHQVGVRDEAKLFGGLGPCGRTLCCSSFLNGFEPVSMKMAKEQSLFLNPLKFSGICGKLMCCLKYEYPTYKEAKSRLPGVGSVVETPKGQGRVVEMNIIKETVGVQLADGAIIHYTPCELGGAQPCCGGECACAAAAAAEVEVEAVAEPESEPETALVPELEEVVPDGGTPKPARRRNRRRRNKGGKPAEGTSEQPAEN